MLDELFWHVNGEAVRRTGAFLLVHAGAVRGSEGQGLLFPGPSGPGKTTLVAGLVRVGFGYLSDEAGAIDPVTRNVYPYPRALGIDRSAVRELWPDLEAATHGCSGATSKRHLRFQDLGPTRPAEPCPVRYVIFPRYEAGAGTELEPLSRAEGAMALGRNQINWRHYGTRALHLVAELAREADVYRLSLGDLEEGVAAVRTLMAAGCGSD